MPALDRTDRFAVFRDLVLFDRVPTRGGPFFLDRFEVTRAEWTAYVAAVGARSSFVASDWNRDPDPTLPVVGVDQQDARGFAAWRFGRLPRWDEWSFASTAGGRYEWPWGDSYRSVWANVPELGLSRLTPVGTFESGRQTGGPFDLIGNAAEWTSTPIPGQLAASNGPVLGDPWYGDALGLPNRLRVLDALPIGAWPVPAIWVLRASAADVPCWVAGGAFQSSARPRGERVWRSWSRLPSERSSLVGMRVATDPSTLLAALLAEPELPARGGLEQLLRFLRDADNHRVLAAEFARVPTATIRAAAFGELLRRELGR